MPRASNEIITRPEVEFARETAPRREQSFAEFVQADKLPESLTVSTLKFKKISLSNAPMSTVPPKIRGKPAPR